MNIDCEKPKVVYKHTTDDGKEFYSLGLSKKKQDGTWETGFISCRFKKDIKLEHKTKILIKGGWLDFYVKDKTTTPFIFINEFEIVDKQENKQEVQVPQNTKTTYDTLDSEVKLEDKDLPF